MAAPDDWELDPSEIKFQEKIASGAFGDLYKGSYCGQVCQYSVTDAPSCAIPSVSCFADCVWETYILILLFKP